MRKRLIQCITSVSIHKIHVSYEYTRLSQQIYIWYLHLRLQLQGPAILLQYPSCTWLTTAHREHPRVVKEDKQRQNAGQTWGLVWGNTISNLYIYNIYICHTYEYITHTIPCQGNHETGLSHYAHITLLQTQDVRREYISWIIYSWSYHP